MNEDMRPTVDPWELLLEHTQRIQQLEQQVHMLTINQGELIKAVAQAHALYDVNKRTLDQLILNQQACSSLLADVLNTSTRSSSGCH